MQLLVATFARARLVPEPLCTLHRTGRSSRIALVHRRLWDALGRERRTSGDPALVGPSGGLA